MLSIIPPLRFRGRLEVVLSFELSDEIVIRSQLILRREDRRDRRSHTPLSSRRRSHYVCVWETIVVQECGMRSVAMKIGIR